MELRQRDFQDDLDETPSVPYEAPDAPPELMVRMDGGDDAWDERVIPGLFHVTDEPLRALRLAAASWNEKRRWARAFAELAVTGHLAHLHWIHHRPSVDDIASHPTPVARCAAREVLAYVERVEAHLALPTAERAGSSLSTFLRKPGDPVGRLPWLAVCAEQDAPWRPVNAFASRHRAKTIDVSVGGEAATIRYIEHAPANATEVILLLHGLGSRLEEVEELVDVLAQRHGYHVVAMDFPSHGYSSHLRPDHVGIDVHRRPEWDREDTFQFLPMLDELVVSFIAALGIGTELVAIGGGSLGGTVALRLAIQSRPAGKVRYVAWSPGSCWGTQQTNLVNKLGIEKRVQRRLRANETIVEHPTPDNARNDSRHDYLYWIYDETIPCSGETSELWFREGMPYFDQYVRESRRDRREVYSESFRRWTLGLAYEQVYYSFIEREAGETHPRYARIKRPVLLLAGQMDDKGFNIHEDVLALADAMACPGWAYSVPQTGHSFHNERPRLLGELIDGFLDHEF